MSWTLTCAVQSSFIQLVPCVTAADEASIGVSTTKFTAPICSIAFIDVYRTEWICHIKFTLQQNNLPLMCKLQELYYDPVKCRSHLHTCANKSVSFKAFSTCAVKTAICVSTASIRIACMCPQFTLINIWRIKQNLCEYHVSSLQSSIIVHVNRYNSDHTFSTANIFLTYSCSWHHLQCSQDCRNRCNFPRC